MVVGNRSLHASFHRVATGNPVVFTLSPPECYMEIRNGYGTSGTRVAGTSKLLLFLSDDSRSLASTGPVRVGDPLTLIIYMRSKYGETFKLLNKDELYHS